MHLLERHMELVVSRTLGDKKVEHSGHALKTKN